MTPRWDAIVLGGGANGLTAAVVLARSGRRVLVLEAEDRLGGQSRPIEFAPGFHAAPLALTAGWVPPAVTRALGVPLPPRVAADASVTGAAGNGAWLPLPLAPDRAASIIRPHSPRDAERWPGFVARLHRFAQVFEGLYQMPAPDVDTSRLSEVLALARVALGVRRLGRADMVDLLRAVPMSVQELVDDTFDWEPLKTAIATGGLRSIRQGPRSGGTGFILLHHLLGAPAGAIRPCAWWADRPDAITATLEGAARAAGVTIRTGARVQAIRVHDDAVHGVGLAGSGEELLTATVLSTLDPVTTLCGLVPPEWLDPEFRNAVTKIKYRGATGFVLYALDRLPDLVGLDRPEEALRGTVSLTADTVSLEKAYDSAKYGEISARPHVEITVPSLRWSGQAPEGNHTLVARVQYAPYALHHGGPWTDLDREHLSNRVTATIEGVAPGFSSRILHEAVLSPADLEDRYGLREGAATQGELTLDQILFMRPVAGWARHRMPIAGLFLGGAGTHPGPGVVGGPGWMAAVTVRGDQS